MRLIDADAMLARLEEWNTSDSTDKALYNFTLNRILEQPTMPSAQLEPSQVARDIANIIENEKDMRVMLSRSEWDNHTVACLLAELFDDPCACNYNGIDEWLPEKCEVIDACPNPVGFACWEQYLKHRVERRTDELGDS